MDQVQANPAINTTVFGGEIKLASEDVKLALLLKTAKTMGFRYIVNASSKNPTISIFLDGEVEVAPPKRKYFKKKNIIVPRDSDIGNAVVASSRTSQTQHPCRYSRYRTPGSVQRIDKKYGLLEVTSLVRLRGKGHDENLDKEFYHDRRCKSLELGEGDFTKQTLSFKEAIIMLRNAAIATQNGTLAEKIQWITEKYEAGPSARNTLNVFFGNVHKYVMKSDIGRKFLSQEKVDMNYSIRYFIDTFKKAMEPVQQYL